MSVAIQIPLALFFGHFYDDRIFLATGYLVAAGRNPYQVRDLSSVFHASVFQGITTFGYPPPWALILGILYRISTAVSSNLLVYNFVIKLPIIAANIAIAYLAVATLARLGVQEPDCRRARIFLLLNPLLFYFGTAWGQFDAIVAALALAATLVLDDHRAGWSGLLLALAVSFKPTAFPILGAFLLYWIGKSFSQSLRFGACFALGIILFCILPFPVFGWDPAPILAHWNFHFTMAGGMSWTAVYELIRNSSLLTGPWQLLGWLWIPGLGTGLLLLRSRIRTLLDVIRGSVVLLLIFLLTRSWLSEPNVILVLPLVALLVFRGALTNRALAAFCILPFLFTLLNNSAPQLLFPILTGSIQGMMQPGGGGLRAVQLAAQAAVVAGWQVAGWRIVVHSFPVKSEQ